MVANRFYGGGAGLTTWTRERDAISADRGLIEPRTQGCSSGKIFHSCGKGKFSQETRGGTPCDQRRWKQPCGEE